MLEKVTREYIEHATKDKILLGSNPHAAAFIKMLVSGKVLGNAAGTQQGLTSIVYEDAPTINNHTTVNERRSDDTRTYGDTRMANLSRGKASFSPLEAEWLHLAFTELFGAEWGAYFDFKEVVTSNPSALIHKGLAHMLPWPLDASAFTIIQLLGTEVGPHLRLVDADKMHMMGRSRDEDETPLEAVEDLPAYLAEQCFWLEVKQNSTQHETCFIFALSQNPIREGNQHWHGMGIARHEMDGGVPKLLGTQDDEPLEVYDLKGQFLIGAITAASDQLIGEVIVDLPKSDFWTENQCQDFIQRLRSALRERGDDISFQYLGYRVD